MGKHGILNLDEPYKPPDPTPSGESALMMSRFWFRFVSWQLMYEVYDRLSANSKSILRK